MGLNKTSVWGKMVVKMCVAVGGDGGRSRDWAVSLNHAVCSDLLSFSFHPPPFMSLPSAHTCTQEKGRTRAVLLPLKGINKNFWYFCIEEHSVMCYHVFSLFSVLSCITTSAAFMRWYNRYFKVLNHSIWRNQRTFLRDWIRERELQRRMLKVELQSFLIMSGW